MNTELPNREPREYLISAGLFLITLVTATFAGFQHVLTDEMLAELTVRGDGQSVDFTDVIGLFAENWQLGLPFSLTLIGILLSHELGHFFAGKMHRIDVSLPFFIPAPTLIGTFGAVIKMRGMLPNRKGLLDVGASGPLVGFCFAVPAYIWGMAHSTVIHGEGLEQAGLFLGDSLLTWVVQLLIFGDLPAGADVMLHPVAFAAWIGFFVTCLNLIPIGQLDGGHIVYALSDRRYITVTRLAFVTLLVMGYVGWGGWYFWAALAIFMGVSRHPHPLFLEPELDPVRKSMGIASIIVFVLTFVPNPFILV